MSIEQLKMILDMVNNVSGSAKDVILLYFGYLFLRIVLEYLSGGVVFYLIFRVAKYGIPYLKTIERLKQLRDKMGIGSNGMMTDKEWDKVVRNLDERKE